MVLQFTLIGIGWILFFLTIYVIPYNDKDPKEADKKMVAKWLFILGILLHFIALNL